MASNEFQYRYESTVLLFKTERNFTIKVTPLNLIHCVSLGRNSFLSRQQRYSTTLGDSTLEVTVLLLTNPLVVGKFLGKSLPRSCVFPELLQTFDEIGYTCLASRMTSLDEENAEKVLDCYKVEDPKRRRLLVS